MNGINVFNVYDKIVDEENKIFKRSITEIKSNGEKGNVKDFYFKNSKLLYSETIAKTSFIKKLKALPFLLFKLITIDIETRRDGDIMVPICMVIYDYHQNIAYRKLFADKNI